MNINDALGTVLVKRRRREMHTYDLSLGEASVNFTGRGCTSNLMIDRPPSIEPITHECDLHGTSF